MNNTSASSIIKNFFPAKALARSRLEKDTNTWFENIETYPLRIYHVRDDRYTNDSATESSHHSLVRASSSHLPARISRTALCCGELLVSTIHSNCGGE
jgi:hypothetical protein